MRVTIIKKHTTGEVVKKLDSQVPLLHALRAYASEIGVDPTLVVKDMHGVRVRGVDGTLYRATFTSAYAS